MIVSVRPRTSQLSPFGAYLLELCRARSMTPYTLGLELGITGKSRMARVIQSRSETGAMLSYEQLLQTCKLLRLTSAESTKLILLGLREVTPLPMLAYLDHLEQEVTRLRVGAAEPPARFKFPSPASVRPGD